MTDDLTRRGNVLGTFCTLLRCSELMSEKGTVLLHQRQGKKTPSNYSKCTVPMWIYSDLNHSIMEGAAFYSLFIIFLLRLLFLICFHHISPHIVCKMSDFFFLRDLATIDVNNFNISLYLAFLKKVHWCIYLKCFSIIKFTVLFLYLKDLGYFAYQSNKNSSV